jgi:hypothetical protein
METHTPSYGCSTVCPVRPELPASHPQLASILLRGSLNLVSRNQQVESEWHVVDLELSARGGAALGRFKVSETLTGGVKTGLDVSSLG